MNAGIITSEILVAGTASTAISTSINADPLITALIGFGTALVTMVGGEIVKFLVAFFKKKTKDLEEKKERK